MLAVGMIEVELLSIVVGYLLWTRKPAQVQGPTQGEFIFELFGPGHECLRFAWIELRFYTAKLVIEWLLLLDR